MPVFSISSLVGSVVNPKFWTIFPKLETVHYTHVLLHQFEGGWVRCGGGEGEGGGGRKEEIEEKEDDIDEEKKDDNDNLLIEYVLYF